MRPPSPLTSVAAPSRRDTGCRQPGLRSLALLVSVAACSPAETTSSDAAASAPEADARVAPPDAAVDAARALDAAPPPPDATPDAAPTTAPEAGPDAAPPDATPDAAPDAAPAPPRLQNAVPLGISAFAALAPDFPRADWLKIHADLARPLAVVLLDFGPVYSRHGIQMFSRGEVGVREPNGLHLTHLRWFVEEYIAATPLATSRHLQLYLFNGPGMRRPGYDRAFDLTPENFNRALQGNAGVRADVQRFTAALTETLAPYREQVEIRLVGVLEDNLSREGAQAVNRVIRNGGWEGDLGRNPCGCPPSGDSSRVGRFVERHAGGMEHAQSLLSSLDAGDVFSNDGWGFVESASGGPLLDPAGASTLVQTAQAAEIWMHLWYDPLQGYPLPAQGDRQLRFDHPPEVLLSWLAAGLAPPPPPP